MDKIGDIDVNESPFSALDETKRKVTRTFLNHAGVFIGSLLCLVCIIVLTTDINFKSFMELANLGAELFVLMFCSYSMYITAFDSGRRDALINSAYITVTKAYDNIKHCIVTNGIQHLLPKFCKKYTEEELRSVRNDILAQAGLTLEDFDEKYISCDNATIKNDTSLSDREKKAITTAMKVKPIKITAEMFMKRGRGTARRTPLGKSPEKIQREVFGRKAVTVAATSILTAQMAFDMVSEPSLTMIATVMMKLLPVVLNGFFGYKFGYDHIAVNTKDYISDQTDFLDQFVKWQGTDNVKILQKGLD